MNIYRHTYRKNATIRAKNRKILYVLLTFFHQWDIIPLDFVHRLYYSMYI